MGYVPGAPLGDGETALFYNLVMLNEEGYRDFYAKSKQVKIESYAKVGSPYYDEDGSYLGIVEAKFADYDYDDDGTFTAVDAGTGSYMKSYAVYHLQRSSMKIDSYVDTINMYFLPDKVRDHVVQLFVKTAISVCGMKVSYSSDGNYTFRYLQGKKTAKDSTCGLFPGEYSEATVRYRGSNTFVVSELEIDQRDAYSVKFRIEARNELNDEFRVYSVELNSSGLWFDGGGGSDDA